MNCQVLSFLYFHVFLLTNHCTMYITASFLCTFQHPQNLKKESNKMNLYSLIKSTMPEVKKYTLLRLVKSAEEWNSQAHALRLYCTVSTNERT